jgi:hypothetical protein
MLRREFISLLAAAAASNGLAKSSGKAQIGLSLSEVSTFGATFRDDVDAYKSAGFDAIGVWEFKLPDNGLDDPILASLHEANLKVATCVPAVATILPCEILGKVGPRDPARRVAMICKSIFSAGTFRSIVRPGHYRTVGRSGSGSRASHGYRWPTRNRERRTVCWRPGGAGTHQSHPA